MKSAGLLAVFSSLTVGTGGVAAAAPYEDPLPVVTYRVNGPPTAAHLSYQTDDGQHQETNVGLPWSTQFTIPRAFIDQQVLLVSAQGGEEITCTITRDGNVVAQATAHGTPARTVCTPPPK
jgi:hypothetical protein